MMNKRFYQWANISLGLTFAAGLFQSALHFQLGIAMYVLSSLGSWFLVVNLLSLVTSLFVLTYYNHKNYRVTFSTGLVATLASLGGFIFLLLLAMMNHYLERYTNLVFFIVNSTGLLYAISLFTSRASNRPWLRLAGILSAILSVIQLAILVWYIDIPTFPINANPDNIRRWVALAERILPVLLIINFTHESRLAEAEKETTSLSRLDLGKGVVVLLALCLLVLGVRLAGESYGHTHISGSARKLAQPFEAGAYVSRQGDTLRYRLLKPTPYDPQKKYPLVVCLPYTCWEDNTRQVEACPPAQWLSREENQKKYPAFVFVPRCPPNTGWGGVTRTPSVAPLAIEAIRSLDQTYSIDDKRRYVTGVSRGGYGSWHFIGTHPELFAAAIPVCGEGDPALANHMTNLSVWAFHGRNDRNVPVRGSRDMIAAISKAGGKPRYTEFPNAAHVIWEDVEKTPGLLDWLFNQHRD